MGKQHELIAVEGELKGAFRKILNETVATFKNRASHFIASLRQYAPFDENDPDVLADERSEMVTTVNEKLDYMFAQHVIPFVDAVLQKEATNQKAVASVEVEGVVIGENLPATFLLGMEEKLKDIRQVIDAIPTLQPGIAWDEDEKHEKAAAGPIYVTRYPQEKRRTKKMVQHKILVQATDKHPAQVEKWNEDTPIGKFTEKVWCGMLSPAAKSAMLGRIDRLSRAVKQARQRANEAEIENIRVAKGMFEYVLGRKI